MIANIVIGAVVAVLLVLAVRHSLKHRHCDGCGHCGCGKSHCTCKE
jgi:hypothetical protein